jgi:putative transposase
LFAVLELGYGSQKGVIVARKRYSGEQIIVHLRQEKVLIAEGKTIIEAAHHLGVSEQTYYRLRKEYGGMEVTQIHRLCSSFRLWIMGSA